MVSASRGSISAIAARPGNGPGRSTRRSNVSLRQVTTMPLSERPSVWTASSRLSSSISSRPSRIGRTRPCRTSRSIVGPSPTDGWDSRRERATNASNNSTAGRHRRAGRTTGTGTSGAPSRSRSPRASRRALVVLPLPGAPTMTSCRCPRPRKITPRSPSRALPGGHRSGDRRNRRGTELSRDGASAASIVRRAAAASSRCASASRSSRDFAGAPLSQSDRPAADAVTRTRTPSTVRVGPICRADTNGDQATPAATPAATISHRDNLSRKRRTGPSWSVGSSGRNTGTGGTLAGVGARRRRPGVRFRPGGLRDPTAPRRKMPGRFPRWPGEERYDRFCASCPRPIPLEGIACGHGDTLDARLRRG